MYLVNILLDLFLKLYYIVKCSVEVLIDCMYNII